MKGKFSKSTAKKPLYKKWWFWVLVIIVLSAIFGGNENKTTINDTGNSSIEITQNTEQSTERNTEQTKEEEFVDTVKSAIQDSISSEDEAITDVTLIDGNLCVVVDLSKADPAPLTIKDLAISRTQSITDSILEIKEYDDLWKTITIDFGEVGKIINRQDDIVENEYGMRYFPSANFELE